MSTSTTRADRARLLLLHHEILAGRNEVARGPGRPGLAQAGGTMTHKLTRRTNECARTSLRAVVGALVVAAAVLPATPAAARTSTAQTPAPPRGHPLGESTGLRAAAGEPRPAAAAARGARLEPCEQAGPGGLCGSVDVPLDRAHPARETVPIFFLYYPNRDPAPASEAILVTGGGPGFSITSEPGIVEYHRGVFDPLLDTRDLIFLDQRGVGRSNAIDCPQIQHGSDDPYRDIAACGQQLGPAASLYTSGEVALDIEWVRRALGLKRLNFYGGSYAAVDIQSYAVRFPRRLRSAVLDSPVTISPYDFDAPTVQAINRAVRLICARSRACAGERADALDSVAWLARRLRHQPVEGVGFDAAGEPHQLRVTEAFLLWRILVSDSGGYVSVSEIAAAGDALRAGDDVPLLRLAAEGDGPLLRDEGEPTVFSAGHNFARFCSDQPMAWDKHAAFATRLRQWLEARAALPRDSFAPYSIDAWLAPVPTGYLGPELCIAWPAPTRSAEPPIPAGATFPGSVPALVLSGDLDSNTPTADARGLAKAWPGSRFVELADSGHHTMVDGRFDCSGVIVVDFIAELKTGDTGCASDTRFGIPAVGRFALAAADARPARPTGGDQSASADRKVATVATAAVTDALRRTFLDFPSAGVRLRGGRFNVEFAADGSAVTNQLDGVRFASDVAVSGASTYSFESESIDATIDVDGPAGADGKLHITGAWFGRTHEATVLDIDGEIAGRRAALGVPAR
jgi:pimeloyl-ACP methyl ester carboxylesterase